MAEGSRAALEKAPDAFRTISEVAAELDVPQHVLRFWESRFREIKPMKRGGGRRYYRPDDLDLLRGIRHLLYGEGYTIRGVQRLLREQGVRFVQQVWQPGAPQPILQPAEEDEPAAAHAAAAEGASAPRLPPLQGADEGVRATSSQGHTPVAPPLAAPPDIVRPNLAPTGLAREDVQKLQAALRDLAECRRLLDAALAGNG
jgi:DNA-binding transcriptional MerR regulator